MTSPRRRSAAVLSVLALFLLLLLPASPSHAMAARDAAAAPVWNFTLGGVPCHLIDVPVKSKPVGALQTCPGVRPGAIVLSSVGQCTFNYVFAGSDHRTYIGTAGHCIVDAGVEQSWAPGTGPVAQDGNGVRIGEFAYANRIDPKDIALIRVDVGVPVNPQMCYFGGPTGINTSTAAKKFVFHQYGNGIGIGDVLPGRTAVAYGMPSPDHVFATGLVLPGDSGSGIESKDGLAVGVVVTIGVDFFGLGTDGVDAGTIGITRFPPQLARATAVTGVTYTIVTAPLL